MGIMSGSSLDGLDLAVCRFSGFDREFSWKMETTEFYPLNKHWTEKLRNLPKASAEELAQTDFDFAYLMADAVNKFLSINSPDFIASHGHTVFHHPEKHSTCQIGNGGALAAKTGIPVICDFRATDVALGGQGAPIVALFDQWAFRDISFLLNLGGIANITWNLPDKPVAFDIGPCNQVLNFLARKMNHPFDKNGAIASGGKVLPDLLEQLLAQDYFQRSLPKTMDNSDLGNTFFPVFEAHKGSVQNKLRTAVEMIVLTVRKSLVNSPGFLKHHKPGLLITGGGSKNKFLVDLLKQLIPEVTIIKPQQNVIDYKEAAMIAFMGFLRINKKHNIRASVTGASKDSVGGAIYWP